MKSRGKTRFWSVEFGPILARTACAMFELVAQTVAQSVAHPVSANPFSSPEPTIRLACGRNRELWEQPFQACGIDADCVKPDGQNSVISFVISKWLLPELSIPAAGQKDPRLWGREWPVGITGE